MSSINLEVVFEGKAVESGVTDAHLLAESLAGYSEVFTRANEIINGEASNAVVFVRSDFNVALSLQTCNSFRTFRMQQLN